MEYVDVSVDNYNNLKKFLSMASSILEFDNDILKNSIICYEGDNIIGSISYEEFNDKALIRYFVFKNIADHNIFIDLIERIKNKARSNNFKSLIAMSFDDETKQLFTKLNFKAIDNKIIYLDELNIKKTKLKDALLLSINI